MMPAKVEKMTNDPQRVVLCEEIQHIKKLFVGEFTVRTVIYGIF